MSDTPRTDAAAIRCACSIYVVPSEFAHQLERENAALREWIEEEGERTDVCTYHILGRKICSYCQCGRKEKAK